MNVNLKRGFIEGAAAAAICAGLAVVYFWRFSPDSFSRWWKDPFGCSDLMDLTLGVVSIGLLGFLSGAFRPGPAPRKE